MMTNESSLPQKLMKAINFTDEDLALNRRGLVSAHQVQLLRRSAWGEVSRLLILSLMFGGTLLAASLRSRDEFLSNAFVFVGGVTALAILALAGIRLRRRLTEIENLQGIGPQPSSKILIIEGEGHRGTERFGRSTRLYYQIGQTRFHPPSAAYNVLVDGQTYQAYYTPSSHILLSLEPRSLPKS